jgi:hypothetical protein
MKHSYFIFHILDNLFLVLNLEYGLLSLEFGSLKLIGKCLVFLLQINDLSFLRFKPLLQCHKGIRHLLQLLCILLLILNFEHLLSVMLVVLLLHLVDLILQTLFNPLMNGLFALKLFDLGLILLYLSILEL